MQWCGVAFVKEAIVCYRAGSSPWGRLQWTVYPMPKALRGQLPARRSVRTSSQARSVSSPGAAFAASARAVIWRASAFLGLWLVLSGVDLVDLPAEPPPKTT
jgi:hypothetical protein